MALPLMLVACDDPKSGLVGTDDREVINFVIDSSFETYPDDPIGVAADCYFDSVAWASLLGADNHTYVNLEGYGIDGSEAETIVQFRVFRATPSFTLSAMELNGEAQSDSVVLALVDDMMACEP
ncbi:MAG: hypothetical protein QF689_04285 [Candidatus Latescibacteria bacterium]|jgi:hypothetical protein|nr:hypothetical protein [Candidatus Latescibacterota bacterium]MDP7447786.1 hypothetical protein [Candidatus Latescibacterota bacterium]